MRLFPTPEEREKLMQSKRLRGCQTRQEIIDTFASLGSEARDPLAARGFAAAAAKLRNDPAADAFRLRDEFATLLEPFAGKGFLFWMLNK